MCVQKAMCKRCSRQVDELRYISIYVIQSLQTIRRRVSKGTAYDVVVDSVFGLNFVLTMTYYAEEDALYSLPFNRNEHQDIKPIVIYE